MDIYDDAVGDTLDDLVADAVAEATHVATDTINTVMDTVLSNYNADSALADFAAIQRTDTLNVVVEKLYSGIYKLIYGGLTADKAKDYDDTDGTIKNKFDAIGNGTVAVGKAKDYNSTGGISSKFSAVETSIGTKLTAVGGDSKDNVVTFNQGASRANIATGESHATLFGKIKKWFADFGTLAFKSSVSNADVATDAAIAASKISGLGSLATKSTVSNSDVALDAGIVASKIDIASLRNLLYPVGSIKMTTTSTNPQTYLGGTWVAWGEGRVPVGVGTGTDANGSEKTFTAGTNNDGECGGEYTHQLDVSEMPSHTHQINMLSGATSGTASGVVPTPKNFGRNNDSDVHSNTSSTGSTGRHNNIQPYITCYMWKRTA